MQDGRGGRRNPPMSHSRRSSGPGARGWIDLELQLLRARSAEEWRRAHALAKAIAVRRLSSLGGDLDDAVQEALTSLDAELGRLEDKGVPPSCALCRILVQKADRVARARRARERLHDRLRPEPTRDPARPDAELDERTLAHAYDAALRAELEGPHEIDREILRSVLLGWSGKEIAAAMGMAASTVSERKSRLIARLRARLQRSL